MSIKYFLSLILGGALSLTSVAFAQGLSSDVPTIVINKGQESQIPIAVVPFAYQGTSTPPEIDVGDIVRNDLNRCGQFRGLQKSDIVEYPSRGSEIKFQRMRYRSPEAARH